MPMKVLGLYLDAETVLGDPQYLDALQAQLGLTMVIVVPGQQTGFGISLPDDLVALNPLGTSSSFAGPGFTWGPDDTGLRRAIEELRRRNLSVWLSGNYAFTPAGAYPALEAVDMLGRSLSQRPRRHLALEQKWLEYCPPK